MHLSCPACNSPIAANDVDLGSGLAKCRACQNVFRFTDDPELAGKSRLPTPRPDGIVRSEGAGELAFVRRWFSGKIVLMTFFALFWDGFLAVWYFLAFHAPNAPLVMKLFPLVHVAVGVFITYAVITGYVNSTWISVGPGHLSVRHGPLPWPGNFDLSAGVLTQLFCEQQTNRGRYSNYFTYDLVAVLADGTRKKVIRGLDKPDVPRYLEEQMEKYLRIKDMAVSGEFRS